MSEFAQLREEISELRKEMHSGFEEIREWKRNADKGMKGDSEYGLWGFQQKIEHNKDKIDTAITQLTSLETKLNRIIAYALGGASVAGTIGGIIVVVVQTYLGAG